MDKRGDEEEAIKESISQYKKKIMQLLSVKKRKGEVTEGTKRYLRVRVT